ncbi:hypothetical protein FRB97_009520 [Tulasnella sp. 331]|nr:hypothetical protein FRB97_009520 [Tulasnella sp. 331]
MGAQQSKQSDGSSDNEKGDWVSLPQETIATSFADLNLDSTKPMSADGSLTISELNKWEAEASKDQRVHLARAVLDHTDLATALVSRTARLADNQVFNTRLDYEATPITNQKSSGRCWLFASTNVIRYDIAQKLKVKDFQLSQSYLFFYDKLEKSNFFLELSIQHADLPIDDRLINHLSKDPIGDGGQLDMAINLLERYGVVPLPIFPESYSSSNSRGMDRLLTTKLREYSLSLRDLVSSLRAEGSLREDRVILAARKLKETYMSEVYRILSVTLGVPPKATDKFTYEYYDTNNRARSWTGTPVEFYKRYRSEKYPLTDSFSLVNDPRPGNPYGTLYTVDKLGNVWGGRPVTYVNTTSQKMKEAVITSIQAGHPVFFGCDVGQSSHTAYGIMDTELYEYETAFGIKLGLTKAQRLQTGESAMTHAMVITAVHLDDDDKPVRYRVENSWGSTAGEDGWFMATDAWFDEFVYQVVTPRKLAAPEHTKVLDAGSPKVYPPWDPMGTLA